MNNEEDTNKRDFDCYKKQESITDLKPIEKESYLNYLKESYKEDLKISKELLFKSPKWSIIAGYYSMHNISKYYLGLNFNLKLSAPEIHSATIQAIKKLVAKKEALDLIEKIVEFEEILPLHFGPIKARNERSNIQYFFLIQKEQVIFGLTYIKLLNCLRILFQMQ